MESSKPVPKILYVTFCAVALTVGLSQITASEANNPAPIQEANNPAPLQQAPAATAPAQVDTKALSLLRQMQDSYKSLKSYSVKVRVQALQNGVENLAARLRFHIILQKPAKLLVIETENSGSTKTVCDGEHIFVTSWRNKRGYVKEAAPTDQTALEKRFRAIRGLGRHDQLLFPESDFVSLVLGPSLRSLSVGKPTVVAGCPVETVTLTYQWDDGRQPNFTYFIGKQDHLLRRITVEGLDEPRTWVETYSDIQSNPDLLNKSFTFTPPNNVKRLKSFE